MVEALQAGGPHPRAVKLGRWAGAMSSRLINRVIRATPRREIDVPVDEPIVSFTFDDAPDSALRHGAAILEAHGARGTFYISGGLAGRTEPDRTLIDAAGCRELAARGHEIGCHSFAHRDMRRVSAGELRADLKRNAAYLDSVAPAAGTRNFAFPYNAGALGHRQTLEASFRTCRAAGERINRGRTDPAFLAAVEIRQPDADARALVRFLDELAVSPGWLIFFTHDVDDKPTPYGCTPDRFAYLVVAALERSCRVLTVDAALDHMRLRRASR